VRSNFILNKGGSYLSEKKKKKESSGLLDLLLPIPPVSAGVIVVVMGNEKLSNFLESFSFQLRTHNNYFPYFLGNTPQ